MNRDDAALLDIANAARLIQEFLGGCDKRTFLADPKTQAAVLHEIVLIGEAAKRLSRNFTQAHPEIPWRDICGMRDRVIHQYHRVDLNRVWEATQKDIPALLRDVLLLLPEKPER